MGTEGRILVKRVHDKRRAAGVCINKVAHGAPFRSGRCFACWAKKTRSPAVVVIEWLLIVGRDLLRALVLEYAKNDDESEDLEPRATHAQEERRTLP
jgi:hypothetical protein